MTGDLSDGVSTEKQGTSELADHSEVASLQNDIVEKVDGLVLEPGGNTLKFSCDLQIIQFFFASVCCYVGGV